MAVGRRPCSSLAGEGLDARDVPAYDEIVDVVGALVSLDRFKVGHVAHDGIFIENSIGTVNVSRDTSNLQSDVDVVHLRQ